MEQMMTATPRQCAWKDEFNPPTPEELRGALPADTADLFDGCRSGLAALEGLVERPRWFGDCWFWTLAYYIEGEATEDDLPVALIIPALEDLQVASPLDEEFLDGLNTRRMKRAIRDGLELATPPYSTRWAIWSIGAQNMLDDVMAIVKQRYAWLRGA